MSSLLILTVGTGTAGKHSDVAQGLANTIRQVRPRKFWLVPSASEKSIPVAELVRETVRDLGSFAAWSGSTPYYAIPNHDDIHECRRLVREVIVVAKRELRAEERLVVNPTSGTKQMSAGATLAALDEEVDQIDFTSGERVDGVVKTGTEVVQSFDLRDFLFQRDLRTAEELFRHGAFFAAARLLNGYRQPEALRARETALCLHEWQRMNYAKAASHAAKFSEEIRSHLKKLAEADEFSVTVLGDLLAGADELLRWGDCEEALARYYRGAEQTAKVRLAETHAIRPPYLLGALLNLLPVGCRLADELRSRARAAGLQLGNDLAWRILEVAQDPIADSYFGDTRLQERLKRRNESMYGHGQEPVAVGDVQAVADRFRNLLRTHLPAVLTVWSTTRRPGSLSSTS
jgi:hypothetical protein